MSCCLLYGQTDVRKNVCFCFCLRQDMHLSLPPSSNSTSSVNSASPLATLSDATTSAPSDGCGEHCAQEKRVLREKLSAARAALTAQTQKLVAARAESSAKASTIKKLETRVSELETENVNLQQDVDSLKRQVKKLKSQLDTRTTEAEELETQVESLSNQVLELSQELKSVQDELATSRKQAKGDEGRARADYHKLLLRSVVYTLRTRVAAYVFELPISTVREQQNVAAKYPTIDIVRAKLDKLKSARLEERWTALVQLGLTESAINMMAEMVADGLELANPRSLEKDGDPVKLGEVGELKKIAAKRWSSRKHDSAAENVVEVLHQVSNALNSNTLL
ncbi:hypothetical protein CAOG_010122 [Capsaspora owczarzaki ATCC 30864]|uniref:Uncharacterized protein n=1 Tax=Capsaspora owczarzaki (strain ATCC 30864) TaxID=595528 RepID=A0A0D2X592_CAPO3|nr:hypothetical protein CAOG_010122 [Capsaspora owczarzaki ATCC 30864]